MEIKNLEIPQKFELHYFFTDDSHTMDAVIRNKCETEILAIIKEISETLDIKFGIETEAYIEGGLKEIWSFVCKNKYTLLIVTNILINVLSEYITRDYELSGLQKEEIRLGIEEKKLNIEKLKLELQKEKPAINIIPDTIEVINNNQKVIKHKSNFYKNLDSYFKITHISTNSLREDNSTTNEPRIIYRDDFKKFILSTDELPIIVDENASIEIISPVLKSGKYKWRGIYNGSVIDFYMKDTDYKDSVLHQEVAFKNGSIIDCVLEISRKMDDIGNEYIYNYSVVLVIKYRDSNVTIETKQGKRYKANKEAERQQFNLF